MDRELLKPDNFFASLGNLSEEELIGFIRDWHKQGEKPEEINAFVEYIYGLEPLIDTGLKTFDCCGTGGDAANTFNISTAAAIVASASGINVTKHGGRSTTSKTGSVDVLEALGLDLSLDQETKIKNLQDNHLAFFASRVSADLLAPVKKLCKKHGETGFLSLLGPLTNPIKLEGQLLGAGRVKWSDTLAQTLLMRGTKRAMVVYSGAPDASFRLDEISAVSLTKFIDIKNPKALEIDSENFAADLAQKIEDEELIYDETIFSPEDIGLEMGKIEDLEGGDAKHNARIIEDILDGQIKSTKLNAVCLNSAGLLYISGVAKDMKEGFEKSIDLIESGKAKANFEAFKSSQK